MRSMIYCHVLFGVISDTNAGWKSFHVLAYRWQNIYLSHTVIFYVFYLFFVNLDGLAVRSQAAYE